MSVLRRLLLRVGKFLSSILQSLRSDWLLFIKVREVVIKLHKNANWDVVRIIKEIKELTFLGIACGSHWRHETNRK